MTWDVLNPGQCKGWFKGQLGENQGREIGVIGTSILYRPYRVVSCKRVREGLYEKGIYRSSA